MADLAVAVAGWNDGLSGRWVPVLNPQRFVSVVSSIAVLLLIRREAVVLQKRKPPDAIGDQRFGRTPIPPVARRRIPGQTNACRCRTMYVTACLPTTLIAATC